MSVPFRYAPAHTAVVVVDVQNDFCHPDGATAQSGGDVTAAEAMVPRLERLLGIARAAGVPVVFVQTLHDPTNDTRQWLSRHGVEPEAAAPGSTCRTGSWGAELYRVAPSEGEPVVTKNRYSAFAGTNLDMVLKARGVRSVLFAGVSTDICVESSIRDGLSADYYVSLLEDCAAAFSPAAHDGAVERIGRNFGTVVGSEDLERWWAPPRSTP